MNGNGSLTINESKEMKKIYSFMVGAVALLAAVSCAQELEQAGSKEQALGETVVYTASTDDPDAKAVLNETTKKSEWVAGDAITVHDGEQGWTFTAAEAGANVDFSNSEGFGDYRPVMAVYPAGTYTANVAAKTAKAYIPTWQQAQAGTYHSPAALAVAYTEGSTFAFKNAHALLKFTVNTDNVTHVIFHGNGSEALTGDVYVTLGEEGVESVDCLETDFTWEDNTTSTQYGTWVECYAWDDNELVDDPSDDTNYFTKGQTYYIAVAPQKFEAGVTVKVKINKGEELVAKTTTKPVETKINTILNLGEIKYEAPATVETVYLQPGVWSVDDAWFAAHFFNSVGGAEDVKMTDEDADGVYEAAVPAGMESVIFCRMNPEFTEFGWDVWDGETVVEDHVWNQTGDLAIPLADDTKVYYNVTAWEAGEWSDTPQESTPDQPEVTPGEPSEWAVVGAFIEGNTNWKEIQMYTTSTANLFVAENVVVPADYTSLLIKKFNDANWTIKYGGGIVYFNPGNYMTVYENGSDICVTKAGTYDFYFDLANTRLYVVEAGADYTTVSEQTTEGQEPEQEEPEVTSNVLYLTFSGVWQNGDERFAAYFFNSAGNTWVSMKDSDSDGIYEVNIPEGYNFGDSVIFCRMKGTTTSNGWSNKWNQTADLTIPTDGKNLYTVKSWDGSDNSNWSTK